MTKKPASGQTGRHPLVLKAGPQAVAYSSSPREPTPSGAGDSEPEPAGAQPGTDSPETHAIDLPEPETAAPPETVTPEPPETAGAGPSLSPPSEAEPLPESGLDSGLYEEARDAEFVPEETETPWDGDSVWPPTPEMEWELFDDSAQTDEAPLRQMEAPSTGKEETMEDIDRMVDIIGTSEPEVDSVLPPRTSAAFFDLDEPVDTYDVQSAGEAVEPLELPDRPLSTERAQAVTEASSARFQELEREIEEVYALVREQVGINPSITNECFNYLLRARDVVVRQDVTRLAQAEYYVELALARLSRASQSRKGARRNAWWILAWGFIWGMVYVAVLVMLDSTYADQLIALLNIQNRFIDPYVLLPSMVWGGVGGVVAIWYSLFKHVSQRDFDSHYNISYLGKPFLGLVLGATVYMAIHLMIVSLGMWPGNQPEGVEGLSSPTIAPWIIYLVAWACGFKENRIFGMVDQVMKRLFSGGSSSAT